MGNQTSQQFPQKGAGYTNNFNDLQNKIESLVLNSKKNDFTETINFSNSSLDLDSLRDQEGGNFDTINVLPRRARYLKYVQTGNIQENPLVGGGDNTLELSSIDEKDFQILKDILKQHQTGGNSLQTDNNVMSATSPQPVDFTTKFSTTSYSEQAGGCKLQLNAAQSGGCGCTDITSPTDDIRRPTQFKSLVGGNNKKPKNNDESELESDDEDTDENDDDDEDENDDEDTNENDDEDTNESEDENEDENDDDDEDHDENSDGDELARSHDSSSSDKKKKHHKQKRHHGEYIESSDSDSEQSEEYALSKKYFYSDHDTFYGSDDNSEYYKHIKNRSMIN